MSVDQLTGSRPPQLVATGVPTDDTVEALLLSVAGGNQDAFVALQSRMTGLMHVNIRRVLRDATRSETVTQETFADVLEDAIHFDPHQNSAQTWLLMRAHQHAIAGLLLADATDNPSGPTNSQPPSMSHP